VVSRVGLTVAVGVSVGVASSAEAVGLAFSWASAKPGLDKLVGKSRKRITRKTVFPGKFLMLTLAWKIKDFCMPN
jgi:hypothetical protein